MQHLEDGTLHALVDGEIPSAELGAIQNHLEACVECRDRLEQARLMAGESDTLIGFIDVPAAGRTGGRAGGQWMKPMALAASLIVAVGLGYVGGSARLPAGHLTVPAETVFVAPDLSAPPGPAAPEQEAARTQSDERRNTAPPAAPSTTQPPPDEEPRLGQFRSDRGKDAPAPRDSLAGASPGRRELAVRSALDEGAVAPSNVARKTGAAERDRSSLDTLEKKQSLNEAAGKALARTPPRFALEELVVTSSAASIRFASISFFDAVARLGGQIRLMEGMVPVRLEARGTAVRVVYPLEQGELVLDQRREADSLVVVLIAPTLGADSLAKLKARIR